MYSETAGLWARRRVLESSNEMAVVLKVIVVGLAVAAIVRTGRFVGFAIKQHRRTGPYFCPSPKGDTGE